MNLNFSFSPLWIVPIVIVAGIAAWWMYNRTGELLPRRWRITLGIFRFVILSLIAVFLLQPLLNSLNKLSYPPIVAFLQDTSESLVATRDSNSVKQNYPQSLLTFRDRMSGGELAVNYYGFSSGIQTGFSPDSLVFDQTGTNLSAALSEVRKQHQNQNLGAIVVVSDGINTAGSNPLFMLENFRQPIYTVLLGDTSQRQDIRIKEVLFNEIAYLENEMPVRVEVQGQGYTNANLKVSISSNGKVLSTKSVNITKNAPQGFVDFLVKPEAVGVQQFDISVSRMQDEITYRNNFRRIFVNVLETRVKIALFAGANHPDIGVMRKAFSQAERYELDEFILRERGTFYNNIQAKPLEDYDLFILHNFPSNNFDVGMVEKIAEQVEKNKKPFILFSGMFTNLRNLGPLNKYMGLTPRNFNPRSEEIIINVLPAYKQHSTYTFADNWMQWMNNSPPIYRNRSEWEVKPTTQVMATAKIKNIELNYPIYALQNHLGRKNMIFVGENFWRMRAHSYVENENFEWFDEWLFNNIKWLIVADDKRKFRVFTSKNIYSGNESVLFKGQVYDDSYNPVPGAEIKMTLTSPDGKEEEYFLNESGNAQYSFELRNLSQGTYRFRAEGKKNERSVGKDNGQFSIGRSNVEHYNLQANKDLLEQIALRTGGEFSYANDLGVLADKLKALETMVPQTEFRKKTKSFYDFGWLLGLILLLLSVEWFTRKFHGML